MSLNKIAEENLLVIRTLMERATRYRALSVPVATWGGSLSLLAFLIHYLGRESEFFAGSSGFLILWGAVYSLTMAGNGYFLFRESQQSGRPVFSAAFCQALYGVLPALLVAGVFTVLLCNDPFKEVLFWMMFYGLGLLGTQHFAPRSMVILGWLFTLSGVLWIAYLSFGEQPDPTVLMASGLMAASFGGYHLIYALLVHLSLRSSLTSEQPAK